LAVAPEWRGRGIGQHLLARAYAWATRTGVKKIQLDVRAGNSAAIRLYERQGFVLEGRERAQICINKQCNHYEDNLIMAKFLDDSVLTNQTPTSDGYSETSLTKVCQESVLSTSYDDLAAPPESNQI
jgi:L-amino acid N-acyltransferase YncA